MYVIQPYNGRHTTLVIQKAATLQVWGLYILAPNSMKFSCEDVRRWAKEIYAEFFGSLTSLEDATDKLLEIEHESARLAVKDSNSFKVAHFK